MHLSPSFRLLVLLLSSSLAWCAPPTAYAPKVKETIASPPGWIKLAPAPADHEIELRIGLPQPNFPALEQHLYEVSDPYHERYGAHLSKSEVEDLIAPHPESVSAIDEWLAEHGLGAADFTRSPAKDWVTIKVPVSLAEKMLDTVRLFFSHALPHR